MAEAKLCSVEGCGKRVNSRGWCKAHYNRFLRHGDPNGGQHRLEGVEWIKAHVGYRGAHCLEWPFGTDQRRYGKVTHRFSRRAHRVMCLLAHGPAPEGRPHATHLCGNSICVNPTHLRWGSVSENMMDRVSHGTANRGERHGMSVLTLDQVRDIKASRGHSTSADVAARYGVGATAIQKIWRGERWAWV